MTSWQELQDTICKWSNSEFGPGERVHGMIAHLRMEVDELSEKPKDIVEMADCLILLMNIAGAQSYSMRQLFDAVVLKMSINMNRKWTKRNEDGSVEHDKDL